MNANRNLEIKVFVKEYKRNPAGMLKLQRERLDHVISKDSKHQPCLKNNEAHGNNAKHKRYHYKKKGTGGYGR